jgi:citrate synthase
MNNEVARTPARDNRVLHDGLEGVLVAETRLSEVDGERGRLVIAGHDVEELAESHGFEELLALLWGEHVPLAPGPARLDPQLGSGSDAWQRALADGRMRAFERLPTLGATLELENGMDALRAAVAQLPESTQASELVAALPVFAAAWQRTRLGLKAVPPDPQKRHAEDLLHMLGQAPDSDKTRALDTYLVTVSDHGLNASTFAARVVASTASDDVSALVAALCALKGPLHGGAPGPVLDMLDAIADEAKAKPYLRREIAEGKRIMGMGHRIYRVRDPRALTLERAVEALSRALSARGHAQDEAVRGRLALARAVEHQAEALLRAKKPERPLRANVEFYTAVLLEAVGIPRALFTPLFAAARSSGWLAHIAEQRTRGRLIRPASRYVGVLPARSDELA